MQTGMGMDSQLAAASTQLQLYGVSGMLLCCTCAATYLALVCAAKDAVYEGPWRGACFVARLHALDGHVIHSAQQGIQVLMSICMIA